MNLKIQQEIQMLEKQKKKNLQNIETEKNKFITEIKEFDKFEIKNSENYNNSYSIWERIKKVLGMN